MLLAPLMWLFGATGAAPTWLKALLFIPALVSVAALFVLAYMSSRGKRPSGKRNIQTDASKRRIEGPEERQP